MRDILLGLLIPAALISSFFSARISILVLLWIGFQRPHDFSWGMWNSLPIWQIAFVIAVLSNVARGQIKPKFPPAIVLYLLFVFWMMLSCFYAFNPDRAWQFFTTYMIPLTFGPLLVVWAINDLSLLKASLWVAAGGLALNGAKTGASMALKGGGHISEQINGFVGDNNVFGLTLCLVAATLLGLRKTAPQRSWIRMGIFSAVALIVLTIIFSQSRGALLTLGVIALTVIFHGKHKVRNTLALASVVLTIYLVVPASYFDRLDTLQSKESIDADVSAMGRVENWKLSWNAAVDNPILGIGPGNHMIYHASHGASVIIRVAHSVYFQILGELGFVAFFLYLAFITTTWFTLHGIWRTCERHVADRPELVWIRDASFWMMCGYTGYIFGSAFLNMLYIEFPWYFAFFAATMRYLLDKELSTEVRKPVTAEPVQKLKRK